MSVLPLPEPDRVLRAVLDDARSGGRGLRATWHLDAGVVVLSLWRSGGCVATVRLAPAEAGRLASLLAEGLAELATATTAATAATGSPQVPEASGA